MLSPSQTPTSALITAVLADPTFGPLINPNRIGAIGFSLGSYTVLVTAGAQPNFGLIDDYCRQSDPLSLCENRKAIRDIKLPKDRLFDPRIKAVVVMAPFGIFFDKAGLVGITRPVLLYIAGNDQELLPTYNAKRIQAGLPSNTPTFMIPKAGHFLFLAPCSATQMKNKPALCKDSKGLNRIEVHKKINADILHFFEQTLK